MSELRGSVKIEEKRAKDRALGDTTSTGKDEDDSRGKCDNCEGTR
jgi:hypothetical protein